MLRSLRNPPPSPIKAAILIHQHQAFTHLKAKVGYASPHTQSFALASHYVELVLGRHTHTSIAQWRTSLKLEKTDIIIIIKVKKEKLHQGGRNQHQHQQKEDHINWQHHEERDNNCKHGKVVWFSPHSLTLTYFPYPNLSILLFPSISTKGGELMWNSKPFLKSFSTPNQPYM